jgi:hypothetical protein
MLHVILPVGLLQCNCSIFGDEQTHEAIVIDPGDEIGNITEVLERRQLKVKAIDHACPYRSRGSRAQTSGHHRRPVYMNERDRELLRQIALGMMNQAPFEARHTASSLLPSPSKSANNGCTPQPRQSGSERSDKNRHDSAIGSSGEYYREKIWKLLPPKIRDQCRRIRVC